MLRVVLAIEMVLCDLRLSSSRSMDVLNRGRGQVLDGMWWDSVRFLHIPQNSTQPCSTQEKTSGLFSFCAGFFTD